MNKAIMGLSVGLALCAGAAYAASASDTIGARQANFKVIGKAFKALREGSGAASPDAAALRASADALARAAGKVHGYFPKGTGPEAGVKTAALPAIWQKPAEFQAAARKLESAANAAQSAAQSGNVASLRAALPGLGGACKGCHDQFKARD